MEQREREENAGELGDSPKISPFSPLKMCWRSSGDFKRRTLVRIFLVRHGESEANVNKSLYQQKADHAIELSQKGMQQSKEAGEQIRNYFQSIFKSEKPPNEFKCRLWTSSYKRARQTASILKESAGSWITEDVRENVMLAEQQFGLFEGCDWGSPEIQKQYPMELKYYRKAAEFGGRFWAKVPLGESRFDVCNRVYQTFGTFHRDCQNGVDNIVVVSHGCTLRAFIMMWLHLTPEWFESEPNPQNGSIQLIENMNSKYIHGGPETKTPKDLLLEQSTTPTSTDAELVPNFNKS